MMMENKLQAIRFVVSGDINKVEMPRYDVNKLLREMDLFICVYRQLH